MISLFMTFRDFLEKIDGIIYFGSVRLYFNEKHHGQLVDLVLYKYLHYRTLLKRSKKKICSSENDLWLKKKHKLAQEWKFI